MFNCRHEPERRILTVSIFFMGAVFFGLEAGARGGGKNPSGTLSSTASMEAGTAVLSFAVVPDPPSVVPSVRNSKNAPAKPAGAETQRIPVTSVLSAAGGRRDPFRLTIKPGPGGHPAAGGPTGSLPAGNRGLIISELRVEGIIHLDSANNMIAMVTNNTKRAYFLRVNDSVYNGVVSKITPEAVYFKENALDSSGRVVTHEVALKLGSAPGEGR